MHLWRCNVSATACRRGRHWGGRDRDRGCGCSSEQSDAVRVMGGHRVQLRALLVQRMGTLVGEQPRRHWRSGTYVQHMHMPCAYARDVMCVHLCRERVALGDSPRALCSVHWHCEANGGRERKCRRTGDTRSADFCRSCIIGGAARENMAATTIRSPGRPAWCVARPGLRDSGRRPQQRGLQSPEELPTWST